MNLPNKYVAIDTETTGLSVWHGARVFAAAACFPDGQQLMWRGDFSGLDEILSDPSIAKVFTNAKFDLRMLRFSGFMPVRGTVWDTMILCHLLDGRDAGRNLSLDATSRKYIPRVAHKLTKEIDTWFEEHGTPKRQRDFSRLPHDILRKRVIGDANLTLRLFERVYSTVAELFPFLLAQEHRLIDVVTKMENRGLWLDDEDAAQQVELFDAIVEDVQQYCDGIIGYDDCNTSAYKVQVELLKASNCLDDIRDRTKTGRYKLNDINMRRIPHPTPHMILIGKASSKMADTFIAGIQRFAVDEVVHPNFNAVGTKTGRFSCSKPNLMNIPIESHRRATYTAEEAEELKQLTGYEHHPHIKHMFKCRPGFLHLHVDKTQAEIAVMAHYTKCQPIIDMFARGESIHNAMCHRLFNEWTEGLKTRTKNTIFGYMYGAGLATIADLIGGGCTIDEARELKQRLLHILPDLPRWNSELTKQVYEQGYVKTIHGRRHYLGSHETYMAMNRMCQGTVGDEIKNRMIAIDDYLIATDTPGTILLNIHDDIAVELPIETCERTIPDIHRIMNETVMPYILPQPAACKITTTRWSNLISCDMNDLKGTLEQCATKS